MYKRPHRAEGLVNSDQKKPTRECGWELARYTLFENPLLNGSELVDCIRRFSNSYFTDGPPRADAVRVVSYPPPPRTLYNSSDALTDAVLLSSMPE